MVAIVTGAGLGLDNSSEKVFGAVGQGGGVLGGSVFNRYGENVTVNAATGNLMIDRTDEVLIGIGPDDVISHAYNSQGQNQGYGAWHDWQFDDARCVTGLTGTVNTTGSTVTRIDSDGSNLLYTWNGTAYVCSTGGNGEYRLTYSGSTWTWADTKNNLTETYDAAHGGRILTSTDNNNNSLTFGYDPTTGHLNTVTTSDGETTTYNYNASNQVVSITTTKADHSTLVRVYYGYDTSGRLSTVTTDLTPNDSSIADNNTVVTTYAYAGTSDRVKKITQTGGAELDFTYSQLASGAYAVATVKEIVTTGSNAVSRTTSFQYNSGNTVVTDPSGSTTTLTYDSKNQLIGVTYPQDSNGATPVYSYTYNTNGDLTTVADALIGTQATYQYDANDNLTSAADYYGNTTSYTYDTNNQVLTKTFTPGPYQAGTTSTIRYVYGNSENLRFVVDGDGEVTQYKRDGYGQCTSLIAYTDNPYDLTGLGPTDSLTVNQLTNWVSGISDLSTVRRTDYTYDFRGNLTSEETYATCNSNSAGQTGTGSLYTLTNYVYDQAGNLLQRQTVGQGSHIETFFYDGLNRFTQTTDLSGVTSNYVWTDPSDKCTVTVGGDLTQVSTYDDAGELVSFSQSSSSVPTETTTYQYDSLGQTSIVTDAMGNSSYALYDNLGRKTASILADGSLTEYRYDLDGRMIASIVHANKLTTQQLGQLVASGNPTNVPLASVMPASSGADVWTWNIYDKDSRLIETIDGMGAATKLAYDNNSNLLSTVVYSTEFDSTTIAGFKQTLPTTLVAPGTSTNDDATNYYYDYEGREIGRIDGDGYFTETKYNHAGEKIETIWHANNVAGYRGASFSATAAAAASSADISDHYYYDDRGLLTIVLDGQLRATQYVYDDANRVTQTILYNGTISPLQSDSYSLSYVQTQLLTLAGDTQNRSSWNVYDLATGNLDYSIDANGGVTAYTYDARGRVGKTVQYVQPRTTTSLPSQSDMTGWVTANVQPLHDRANYFVYDSLGNLRFTIDGENYVTESRYNKDNQKVLAIRYTGTYLTGGSIPDVGTMVTWAGATIPSDAVQTGYSYDIDGRLTDVIADASGYAVDTHTDYDGLGRVQYLTEAYHNNGDDSVTAYSYYSDGSVQSVTSGFGSGAASTIQYTYDGQGNILSETDGNLNTTNYTYDSAGQMLTKKDALNNLTSYFYDSFGNVLTTTDPLNGVIYSFYDALNRQILQIDQLGYGTATTYTIGGAVQSVTRYATAYTNPITPGDPPNLTTSQQDATTTFTRDKLDRVIQMTDAEGFYEKYDLDTFGDRIHIFAKSSAAGPQTQPGGETIDTYDRRGLLLSEVLPEASYDSSGNQLAATVTNTYSYDSRGNRKQMVEAYQLPEQRTTTYNYDNLNRLVQVIGDQVSVISNDLNSITSNTPTTNYQYDNRGNLVKTTDATGAITQFYYDALNRKTAQVDALGDYTQWTYDDNSNMLTVTSYATPFATMPALGGTGPSPRNPWLSRLTTYSYDQINRLTNTTVANLLTGSYSGGNYTTTTGSVSTSNTYNKTPNSLRQVDGNGNSSWIWYDALGRKIAEVDPDKYITLYTLDTNGNVTQETRYYNAYVGTISNTTTCGTIQTYAAAHPDSVNDRITMFQYDRIGQRTQEARLNVMASTVNSDGTLSTAATSSTINYRYNGLGEVLSKEEATGDTTTYTYDAAGRQIAIDLSSFTSGTATMQLHTVEDYDGLGDLTYTSAYDALASQPVKHNTRYIYGAGGRLASMIDANNFERDYFYDAAGRVILTKYSRLHSDGNYTTEGDFTNYDALGRTVAQGTASNTGTWSNNDVEQLTYDAYGSVIAKSVRGVVQQTFAYDNGGRMWESTDEGVTTVYLYDKNGNQTLSVTSDGNALASGSWSGFASANDVVTAMSTIGVTQVQGMVETITVYDARNQATSTRMPQRQLSANYFNANDTEDIITSRTYNAFGEVLTEKDGNLHTTTYTYNTLGKVTSQALPATTVYDEHNNPTTVNPTQTDYYDASGRLVGTKDANNNLNTRWLLANTGYDGSDAQVIQEFHADGGQPVNTYDVFGDLTESLNEVLSKTDYTYDNLGQLRTETHPTGTGGLQLVDNYTYDGLGQRLTHWNSEFGNGYVDRTDYDAEGRVAQTVDMEGHAITYSYVWSGALTTSGLGQFGGWTKTTTDVDSGRPAATEQDDVDGRTIAKTDFGGNVYGYTYDLAGRLSVRTDSYIPAGATSGGGYTPSGEVLTYTYYNTGLTKEITSDFEVVTAIQYYGITNYYDGHNIKIADYSYDKNGNQVFEDAINRTIYNGGTFDMLVEYETATYNAANRILSLQDTAPTISGVTTAIDDPITINWKYDANGNIRNRKSTYYLVDTNDQISGTKTTQDDWYTYDKMNRFLITQGRLDANNNITTVTNGTTITYDDAGERLTAVGNGETDTYHYSADGHVTQADIATSSGTQHAYYTNDLMGRVTYYEEDNASGTKIYSKQTYFNHISQDTQDIVYTVRPNDGTYTWTTTYDFREQGSNGYNGVYDYGAVTHSHTTTVKQGGGGPAPTDAVYSYMWLDGAVQSGETYDSDTGNPNNTLWTSVSTYDQRHNLTNATIADGYDHGVGYEYNIDGEVVHRQEGVAYPVDPAPDEFFFYFGGIQVGDISNNGTTNVDYGASITQQTAKPGGGFFTDGATSGTEYADFDQSYDAINGLTYGEAPSTYTVQAGDTLQSIAQQIWGDSNFWYLLADANGLDASSQLAAGITLIIPNSVANNQNNTSTYRVYDPNSHIGNISPTHPPQPQPHHSQCGVLGEILMAVIAVVVAYFTAGAALGAMGVTGAAGATSTSALMAAASFPEAVAAGAIGGAAGSIVSQGVGLATGIQKSFNWGAVGMAALGGAIGAGLGPNALTGANGAFSSLGAVGGAIARGALGDAITQGIGVATGLQKSFDWAGVAAAGVSAGVGAYVGQQLHLDNPQMPSSGITFVSGMAGLIAGAATRSLISGTDFGDNILKGLPDAIGQTVGAALEDEAQNQGPIEPVTVTPEVQLGQTPSNASLAIQATPFTVDQLPQSLPTQSGYGSPPPPIDSSLPGSPEYAANGDGDQDEVYLTSAASNSSSSAPATPSKLPTLLLGLHLTQAQFSAALAQGIYSQLGPDTSSNGVNSQSQYQAVVGSTQTQPDLFSGSNAGSGSSAVNSFVVDTSHAFASAQIGGDNQNYEKFYILGQDSDGTVYVMGIGVGGTQGAAVLPALQQCPGAIAVVHDHYYNGPGPGQSVYGLPNGGDDTSEKALNIPDYVTDGADHQIWVVGRDNGQISEARVYPGGETGSPKPYDPYPWLHQH